MFNGFRLKNSSAAKLLGKQVFKIRISIDGAQKIHLHPCSYSHLQSCSQSNNTYLFTFIFIISVGLILTFIFLLTYSHTHAHNHTRAVQ